MKLLNSNKSGAYLTGNIIKNSFSNIFGVLSSALIQLVSVPILVQAWGGETYGLWLMLTTIPSYFALTDLGFAAAATSDMTMAVARGDREAALRVFQSVSLFILLVGLTAVALTAAILGLLSFSSVTSGSFLSDYGVVIALMVLYSALVLLSRTVLAGFRSTGNYAVGTFLYDGMVLVEGLMLLLFAWVSRSFLVCGAVFILCRAAIILVEIVALKRMVPWLQPGFSHASVSELRRLLRPAIAALAIPTALAVNIQGIVLITGTLLSPAAVAVLGPVRTASRVALQGVGIVNRATMPEFSAATARMDMAHLMRLLKLNTVMLGAVLLPGAILFAIFGRWFVGVWTGGTIVPDRTFVALMALAMFLQGVWFFGSNLLLAVNRHVAFAAILLPASAVSIVLAAAFATTWGLSGVALALIISEALSLGGLAVASRGLLHRSLAAGSQAS